MKTFNCYTLFMLVSFLSACGSEAEMEAASKTEAAASQTDQIAFVDTQASQPIQIDAALFETPAAQRFLKSGSNAYIGDKDAVETGKQLFSQYLCAQCHGADAKGLVGPSLLGPAFKYAKNATDKGMFETIWNGTNGGMGAKGVGVMDPEDLTVGLKPDDVLKVIAWVRSISSQQAASE